MIKPIFAHAKSQIQNLDAAVAAGASLLPVASPEVYAPGDKIFCAENDGSLLEYLGNVRTVAADSITVDQTLENARTTASQIWKAASFFQWIVMPAGPVEKHYRQGVAVERGVGGALWSVRSAAPSRQDILRFRGVSRAHFSLLRNWLDANVRGGIDTFTRVNEFREINTVRLLDCDFVQREEKTETIELEVQIEIIETGAYA
ncbi:MAG: hypothetical protein ACLFUS_03080 [Candidatus Sumerlaeia bacterium]